MYGTKYGTTESCANKLKEYLSEDTKVLNIKDTTDICLDDYDSIIIGSPVYAGMFNKGVKKFIEENKDKLIQKKLGLFMCCMADEKKAVEQFKQNVPKEVLDAAKFKENFGGEFKFSKMNFFEKNIIKLICKKEPSLANIDGKSDVNSINDSAIRKFARVMEE